MLRGFRNCLWGRLAALILVVGLFHPLALASNNDDKKESDNNAAKKAGPPSPVDMSEIIHRLEMAEQTAAAAREAADAANARATELEKKFEETNKRLKDTEAELARVKAVKAAHGQQAQPPQNGEQGQQPSGDQAAHVSEQNEQDEQAEPEVTLASLNDRLDEIKDEVERNKDQIESSKQRLQDSSREFVETGEKFNVKLFGTLLFNSYYNTAGTDDPPTGLYLLGSKNTTLENGSNFGSTIRQTQLGFAFSAPQIGNWRLFGDLQLDFFGGNPPVYNGRAFSPLRLRIARAHLQSGRLMITIGQDDPIISPLNPTSLAQVGFPPLAESGNLWSWTPQAKVAYRLMDRENERVTIEGGILAPYNGQTNRSFQFETRPDAGERGRFPAVETRISYARGDLANAPTNAYLAFDPQPFQIGIGAHYAHQLAVPATDVNPKETIIQSVAIAGDYVIPLGSKMTLSGEAFWGRSLGGLGGGIVQGIVFPFYGSNAVGIRSRGGWAQLQIRAWRDVAFHLAYGVDDPYNKELRGTRFDLAGGTSRAANRTFSANMLYRFRKNFIVSTEYRFMQTYFIDEPSRVNNHINIGFGYLF